MVPDPLRHHRFLYRITTSGVKVRPVLKKINDIYFRCIEHGKLICKNNYNL